MAVRPELRLPAEMPLADQRCVVAVLLQQRGDGRVLGRQPDVRRRRAPQRLFETDGKTLRIPAGDVGAAGRRADRRGSVRAREHDAFFGEGIERRGLVVRAAVAAQIAVAEIVGEDEHDIRAPRRSGGYDAPRAGDRGGTRGRLDELTPRHPAHGRSVARTLVGNGLQTVPRGVIRIPTGRRGRAPAAAAPTGRRPSRRAPARSSP